jgi:endonuclease/exonuclease/phosphatase family metal-dependent hydrolase
MNGMEMLGLLLLSSVVDAQEAPRPEPPALSIVTWNVWNGFAGGKRVDEGCAWLRERGPDVVALQELTGITEARLGELAARWGHDHAATAKEGGYPVGLTSRTAIEVVERRTEGLHHGYLHARTAGIDFVVVHLHPGSWEFRLKEARAIAPLLERLLAAGRPVVVLGDFNAHSAVDRESLATRRPLIERRREQGGGNLRGAAFDHETMQTFLALGLHDLAWEQRRGSASPAGTFPSRVLEHARTEELQRGFLERIDFVLAGGATAARCTRVVVPRGGVLEQVSDHYPVVVVLGTRDSVGDR